MLPLPAGEGWGGGSKVKIMPVRNIFKTCWMPPENYHYRSSIEPWRQSCHIYLESRVTQENLFIERLEYYKNGLSKKGHTKDYTKIVEMICHADPCGKRLSLLEVISG
jgi:hypothetical protein